MTAIRYPLDYQWRCNPGNMRLALLKSGIRPPDIRVACELGFGQGGNLVLHAASGPAHWLGNDVNPEHVREARKLTQAAGARADLHGDTFVEFAARDDLPDVDYIVVSGVWSWVSDRSRSALLDFAKRRLKPGGVLFLGYVTLPGLAGFMPVRHLMAQHAKSLAGAGDIAERVQRSLGFLERTIVTLPSFLEDHPRIQKQIDALRDYKIEELAHDYFSRDWRPMHFADVASQFAEAGLVHAGKASYRDQIEALSLTAAQRALLADIDAPLFRETVSDFLLNRAGRYDYWMKPSDGAPQVVDDELRAERFVLIADRPELPFEARAPLKLQGLEAEDQAITAVLEVLAQRRPRSVGDIEIALSGKATLAVIVEALQILLGCRVMAHAQPEPAVEQARTTAARFNAFALDSIGTGTGIGHFASPLLGGGFRVRLPEQLFLKARRSGGGSPEKWVRFARQALASLDRTGKQALTEDQLATRAAAFAATQLPLLESLLIA